MKFREIRIPVSRGLKILTQLKAEYPTLFDSHLILSGRLGQCPVDSSLETALHKCEKLFLDSPLKNQLLEIYSKLTLLRKYRDKQSISLLEHRLHKVGMEAPIDSSVEIVLIFDELRNFLIEQLQKHPLIDQKLPPQSKSSIKIVLGTLESLTLKKEGYGSLDLENVRQVGRTSYPLNLTNGVGRTSD